jgi:hypothetical protein
MKSSNGILFPQLRNETSVPSVEEKTQHIGALERLKEFK